MRRKSAMQFSNGKVLSQLPKSWRVQLQPLLPVLYALGLVCLVVALARPQKGLDESRVHTEGVDMVLLLDLSESMDTQDFVKLNRRMSRLDATKDVVERFLKKRPNDRIGIVGFASLPYAIAPLTLDHNWLISRLEGLHTGMLDGRRTAIGDGIASAVNRLRESEAKSKIIILLTDGANNFGTLSPENAARAAEALGIKIYTIGAGGAGNGFSIRRQEVDEETLQKVAKASGGKFYRARNLESLQAVYDEIDQLEKTEIEVEQFTSFEEISKGWILAGILLLLSEQLLSLSRMGRLV
jgi:Ca-activated chloride channel family protein